MKTGMAIYNLSLPLTAALAHLAAPFSEKIADGIAGRRGWRERWTEAAAALHHDDPLVWFHVSSVGEYLQALPVIDLLEQRRAGRLAVALTFYSPSGLRYVTTRDRAKRNRSVRFIDYLPIDTRGNVRLCLDALRPDMIVYVKFDLWPNLIDEASRRGIPQILVSGTLSPGSRRLSRAVRGFYGGLYSRLTAVAAISDEDADRFRRYARSSLEVMTAGDTRFDSVCRRVDGAAAELPAPLADPRRRFVIAGSTWPKDEDVVIPGFAKLRSRAGDAALILVPHEPTPERLGEIERSLRKAGLASVRLSALAGREMFEEPVVVADGVGYLAELYRAGAVAYVGGSFTTGVHNVMEPAVLGLPVLFGPRIRNSYEARWLVELEAGGIVRTAADFTRETEAMLRDEGLRARRGEIGATFIRNSCGATLHCVDLIERHLKSGRR